MSLRRTALACVVTFVCALAVFTLPRFAWNSLQGAVRPQAVRESVAPPSVVSPPVIQVATRSVGQRLTGLFGIVLILGIGLPASRHPPALHARVVGRGVGGARAVALLLPRGPPGSARVPGSIRAAYIALGIEARHLLTAVIMTAPGTIMMAKTLEPETDTPQTLGGVRVDIPRTDVNVVDAAARGTTDGLHLMLNVIAMLVSFIALVALGNGLFGC